MNKIKTAQSIVGSNYDGGRPLDDFYPTPPKVIKSLLEIEAFNLGSPILEPACGDGSISKVLMDYGYDVVSSDLYAHGYGISGVDFLGDHYTIWPGDLITNPPFKLLERFIEKAMDLECEKFAFLAKLSALEGEKRSRLLLTTPLKSVWVFRKRILLTRNGEKPRSSGMIAFAWFVWDRSYWSKHWGERPMIGWI